MRIEETADRRLALDLSRWKGVDDEREETVTTPGPRIVGSNEALLEMLRDPIRDLFATLEEQDADLEAITETYFSAREGYSFSTTFWDQLLR